MIIHVQRFCVPLHSFYDNLLYCHLELVTRSVRKSSLELEYQEYYPHFGQKHYNTLRAIHCLLPIFLSPDNLYD
ncbi:hypothetical protein [Coleofasciculus sp.]|uniref:hypothetical protein n=1 Tax=Coleofasciculus sp. TaxID=3100458 RepID=UPI0039F99F12